MPSGVMCKLCNNADHVPKMILKLKLLWSFSHSSLKLKVRRRCHMWGGRKFPVCEKQLLLCPAIKGNVSLYLIHIYVIMISPFLNLVNTFSFWKQIHLNKKLPLTESFKCLLSPFSLLKGLEFHLSNLLFFLNPNMCDCVHAYVNFL